MNLGLFDCQQRVGESPVCEQVTDGAYMDRFSGYMPDDTCLIPAYNIIILPLEGLFASPDGFKDGLTLR